MYCYLEKSGIVNFTFEVVRINISSLEECDRLDSYYVAGKVNRIKNEKNAEMETIKKELNLKLNQIEKEKAIGIKAATSFSWLAILVICLVFLINVLIDFQKLICYLKKYFCVKKRLNKVLKNIKVYSDVVSVVEKETNLFNHAYFQKRRKLK